MVIKTKVMMATAFPCSTFLNAKEGRKKRKTFLGKKDASSAWLVDQGNGHTKTTTCRPKKSSAIRRPLPNRHNPGRNPPSNIPPPAPARPTTSNLKLSTLPANTKRAPMSKIGASMPCTTRAVSPTPPNPFIVYCKRRNETNVPSIASGSPAAPLHYCQIRRWTSL